MDSIFFGALANCLAIIVGGLLGIVFQHRLSKSLLSRLEEALGWAIFFIGMKMCLEFKNALILISSLALGLIIGELINLQKRSDQLASFIEHKMGEKFKGQFAHGFSSCSILFCTGAMGIVGSLESGSLLRHDILLSKSLIDGILSVGLAASLGIGVVFSSITILIYEGLLTFFSTKLSFLSRPEIIAEISGVGGALVAMIGLELARIKKIHVANYLPGLAVVVLLMIFKWSF